MEHGNDFTLEALETLEPLVNPVRQYRNRSKKKQNNDDENVHEFDDGSCKNGNDKIADVLAKIASLQKPSDDNIDRTKLIRTYNVKLRLKKTSLYKCFDCDSCFTNADFLEMHEKSAHAHDSSGSRQDIIDLCQDQAVNESDMNVKQNAWFAGDFYDAREEDDDEIIQLDCTVEEREDNFDIIFDRAKCEKTYTVKYKVEKQPVGKCESCERPFYTVESLELHKMEHERLMDFDEVEPRINISSPKIEESTLRMDESFYQALSEMDASDILEVNESTVDTKLSPTSNGVSFEYRIVPRRVSNEIVVNPPPTVEKQNNAPSVPIGGKFQCEICSKRFRFRPAFNVHLRTHDNSRPFQCPDCSRRFISRAKLFLHSYGHSRNRRELQCDVCGEKYGKPRQLLEHVQCVHKETQQRTEEEQQHDQQQDQPPA